VHVESGTVVPRIAARLLMAADERLPELRVDDELIAASRLMQE
jgi:hypothetical protein